MAQGGQKGLETTGRRGQAAPALSTYVDVALPQPKPLRRLQELSPPSAAGDEQEIRGLLSMFEPKISLADLASFLAPLAVDEYETHGFSRPAMLAAKTGVDVAMNTAAPAKAVGMGIKAVKGGTKAASSFANAGRLGKGAIGAGENIAYTGIEDLASDRDAGFFDYGLSGLTGLGFGAAFGKANKPLTDKSELFIGEKGAAALDNAENAAVRKENLNIAKEMEKGGKSEEAIKLKTGWEKGADGKPRYEIPDILIDKSKILNEYGNYHYRGKMGNLIDNKELFAAYPHLKDINIEIGERVLPWSPAGYYDPETNTLGILLGSDFEKKNISSTINHEVQHFIQNNEGFAKGSSPQIFKEKQSPLPDFNKELSDLKEEYMHSRTRKKFPEWLASNSPKISNAEVKGFVKSYKKGDVPYTDYKARLDEEYQKHKEFKYAPDDLYYRTAGEVEARNVQHRLNMTPEERRGSLASKTEDVPRHEQVFVEGNNNNFSIAPEKLSAIEDAKHNVPEEKAAMYKEGISLDNTQNRLLGLLGENNQTILKSIDGEEVKLSKTSIGKLLSKTAINKSINNGFTINQHFAAAADIDNLFANSIKVLTHPDRIRDPNVKAMHRFVAPLFGDNAAYITVKEATEQGKRIYSIELIELGKLEGNMKEVEKNSTTIPATSPPKNNIENSVGKDAGGRRTSSAPSPLLEKLFGGAGNLYGAGAAKALADRSRAAGSAEWNGALDKALAMRLQPPAYLFKHAGAG